MGDSGGREGRKKGQRDIERVCSVLGAVDAIDTTHES